MKTICNIAGIATLLLITFSNLIGQEKIVKNGDRIRILMPVSITLSLGGGKQENIWVEGILESSHSKLRFLAQIKIESWDTGNVTKSR